MALADIVEALICPHCAGAFELTGRTLRCTTGHCFDLARHGHVNLHGAPGANADTAQMVAARLEVLTSGLFDPLSEALSAAVSTVARADDIVVDAGAGPGHHIAAVVTATGTRGVACDVSPYACRRAAKLAKVGAVVADTWAGLPVADGAAAAVLSVFAPRNWADFARMTGSVIVAAPLPDHLRTLRERFGLLTIDHDKSADIDHRAAAAGWMPVDHTDVRATREVSAELASALVAMGPNAFHQTPEITNAMPAEVAVRVTRYEHR